MQRCEIIYIHERSFPELYLRLHFRREERFEQLYESVRDERQIENEGRTAQRWEKRSSSLRRAGCRLAKTSVAEQVDVVEVVGQDLCFDDLGTNSVLAAAKV